MTNNGTCWPQPDSDTLARVIDTACLKLQKDMTTGELVDLLAKLPRDRPVVVSQNDGTEASLRMLLCNHDGCVDKYDPVCHLYVRPRDGTERVKPFPYHGPTEDERARRKREADEFSAFLQERRNALREYRESRTLEERVARLETLHQDRLTSW